MSKDPPILASAGLPLLTVEDPEVVRLRIAKEHLDKLMEMKQAHLSHVMSTVSSMVRDFNAAGDWKEQGDLFDKLVQFVCVMGISDRKEQVGSMPQCIGIIMAHVALWHRGEIALLHKELSDLLRK